MITLLILLAIVLLLAGRKVAYLEQRVTTLEYKHLCPDSTPVIVDGVHVGCTGDRRYQAYP